MPARFTRRNSGTAPRPVRSATARRGAASVAATGPGASRSASASAASRPGAPSSFGAASAAGSFRRVRGSRVRRIVQRVSNGRRQRSVSNGASVSNGETADPSRPPSGAAADGTYASRTAPVAGSASSSSSERPAVQAPVTASQRPSASTAKSEVDGANDASSGASKRTDASRPDTVADTGAGPDAEVGAATVTVRSGSVTLKSGLASGGRIVCPTLYSPGRVRAGTDTSTCCP